MYYTYIIQSQRTGRYYIGSSGNPTKRVSQHNEGWTRSTKGRGPWYLVYTEAFESKPKALEREREIKRMKSSKYIERIISAGGRPVPI